MIDMITNKRKPDPTVYDSKTQEFVCNGCNARYKPNLPMPVTMFCATGEEFLKLHRNCKVKGKS